MEKIDKMQEQIIREIEIFIKDLEENASNKK